ARPVSGFLQVAPIESAAVGILFRCGKILARGTPDRALTTSRQPGFCRVAEGRWKRLNSEGASIGPAKLTDDGDAGLYLPGKILAPRFDSPLGVTILQYAFVPRGNHGDEAAYRRPPHKQNACLLRPAAGTPGYRPGTTGVLRCRI